jgi:hypothetical protein
MSLNHIIKDSPAQKIEGEFIQLNTNDFRGSPSIVSPTSQGSYVPLSVSSSTGVIGTINPHTYTIQDNVVTIAGSFEYVDGGIGDESEYTVSIDLSFLKTSLTDVVINAMGTNDPSNGVVIGSKATITPNDITFKCHDTTRGPMLAGNYTISYHFTYILSVIPPP